MPEGWMAAVNSYLAPLQLPVGPQLQAYTSAAGAGAELLEDFPNHQSKAEGHLSNGGCSITSGTCASEKLQQQGPSCHHQLKSTKSTESLNSLLKSLPEVVIPETLHNPLPLQCLAASALPEAVREEIDRVLDRYSNAMSSPIGSALHVQEETSSAVAAGGSSSPVLTGAERDMEEGSIRGDLAVNKEGLAVQVVVAGEGEGDPIRTSGESALIESTTTATLSRITLKRRIPQSENINDLGLGFQVTGGVWCDCCKTLHTVVTAVNTADCAHSEVDEGVAIKQWAGKELEDCSFEEVKAFLRGFAESDVEDFEVVLKKCSGHLITPQQDMRGASPMFQTSWQRGEKALSKLPTPTEYQLAPPTRGEDTDSSGEAISDRSRPSSGEIRDSIVSTTFQSSTQSPSSPSRSPTPEKAWGRNENEHVMVSIPRLESNARELSVRPRSPLTKDEGKFSRFANGMVQLSLRYDFESEDLVLRLHKVCGQSNKEIHDVTDVFINTYLHPDTMHQGVRSIGVSDRGNSSPEQPGEDESKSYVVNRDELDKCVLRVLLWDARKSKKPIFRGEVVLGFCDTDVVSLNGLPVWFTVCPLDPNLPVPPNPVHYKLHGKHQKSVEQMLHRIKKMKAWHFGTLTAANMKSSMAELGLDSSSPLGGRSPQNGSPRNGSPKHGRKAKSEILDALKSEMESDLARHTINEAKLAKLHSILNVLRNDKEDSSDPDIVEPTENQEQAPKRPEFLRVFDTADANAQTLPSNHRRRKRKNKVSKAVLRVLHEDLAAGDLSSDSGDNLDDSGPSSSTLNRQSVEWLHSRQGKFEPQGSDVRPRSDSFQTIPKLRDSLNAGKVNKVTNYAFDSPKKRPLSRDVGHVTGERGHVNGENGRVANERGHGTSIDLQHSDDTSGRDEDAQFHYTVMDEDSPLQQDAKYASPVCKHYSVPVQISVHRISVKDVDEPLEIEPGRTMSFNVAPTRDADVLASIRPSRLSERDKPRSRSLGDMDLLGSDDEVLLVRAPVADHTPTDGGDHHRSDTKSPSSPMEMSSLDFTTRRVGDERSSLPVDMHKRLSCYVGGAERRKERNRLSCFVDGAGKEGRRDSGDVATSRRSWLDRVNRNESMQKSRSLDNLIESPKKAKSRQGWKFFSSHSKQASSDNGGNVVGDAKLEVEFNDLNPQHPVMMVKLLDILFQSIKQLPSEFLMKCQVVHSSSGVAILKDKTVVNIKNPSTPSAPLGLLQFQTDISNLSLEITFFSVGIFSKKEIGHISLDLNSLSLSRDAPFCKWLQITRNTTTTAASQLPS